ncbi:glycoside hydrolase superfamily [Mycena galopus ATCC 62051]|nr:glycoside hydrolase superfamily [Mycena galopus ATCC 62051]
MVPHDLFNFPETVRQNLSNLLFSPTGLGLSSYRYNIGGGGVGVINPVRAPQTFYVSPGVYNFSADPEGVFWMQQANSHAVPITAFVNSAPPQLTSNKASCGGSFINGTGAAYGKYLADVISHWRSTGLMINFISPMNEPDNSMGTPGSCGQEGMEVSANQGRKRPFHGAGKRGLSTEVGILGDESSSLSLAVSEYPIWLPSVASKLAAIVHHTYDFPSDASYTSFVNTVKSQAPGKEVCCSLGTAAGAGRGYTQGFDPTITNALMFSGLVFQSLVLASEPHYDFWTLVSNGAFFVWMLSPHQRDLPNDPQSVGWTDGMIYYDDHLTKHFWTYKHFGNFVKPGSVRLPLTGSDVREWMMAVSTPTTYSLILMNPNTTDNARGVLPRHRLPRLWLPHECNGGLLDGGGCGDVW